MNERIDGAHVQPIDHGEVRQRPLNKVAVKPARTLAQMAVQSMPAGDAGGIAPGAPGHR